MSEDGGVARTDGRGCGQVREISFQTGFQPFPEGSVLVAWGGTRVVCSATFEDRVPPFLAGKGTGWITAEYDMLPGSGNRRIRRDRISGGIKGRSHEIQRLIGRSLRQCADLSLLGERTLVVDCDVLTADGGTRVASISGGAVAARLATRRLLDRGKLERDPFLRFVAAVSVGLVDGTPMVDLCYDEDSRASMDMNLVVTEEGQIVELQTAAEQATAPLETVTAMARMGLAAALEQIVPLQREVFSS
ncbi:ribonuclease PH [Candidatus Fermentibacterales bacterium]|nr:ribonuclease PH [Candidatus Fermentibacterales bacterium]